MYSIYKVGVANGFNLYFFPFALKKVRNSSFNSFSSLFNISVSESMTLLYCSSVIKHTNPSFLTQKNDCDLSSVRIQDGIYK